LRLDGPHILKKMSAFFWHAYLRPSSHYAWQL